MQIINDQAIVEDSWVHFDGEGDMPDGDVIVSLHYWQEHKDELSGRKIGVRLEPDDNPNLIRQDLQQFYVIAVNFPSFGDGRGYSTAKILRDRFGYEGEIRATGDVMRDQLFYMTRCGFNAFEIKAGKDINDALEGLSDFSVKYQSSSDQKQPLYNRR